MKRWNEIGLYTVETRFDRPTKSWRTTITGPRFDVWDEGGRLLAPLYSGTVDGAEINHSGRIRDAVRLEAFFTRENENHRDEDGDEALIAELYLVGANLHPEFETSNSRVDFRSRVVIQGPQGL